MPIYRVRHIASGLFYRPCTEVQLKAKRVDGSWSYGRGVKTNLSKTPKLYHKMPSQGMLSGSYYNHLTLAAQMQAAATQSGNPEWHPYDFQRFGRETHLEAMNGAFEFERQDGNDWINEGPLHP